MRVKESFPTVKPETHLCNNSRGLFVIYHGPPSSTHVIAWLLSNLNKKLSFYNPMISTNPWWPHTRVATAWTWWSFGAEPKNWPIKLFFHKVLPKSLVALGIRTNFFPLQSVGSWNCSFELDDEDPNKEAQLLSCAIFKFPAPSTLSNFWSKGSSRPYKRGFDH